MFTKSLIAATVATPILASSALAGPYIKGEAEADFSESGYSGSSLELVVGNEMDITEKLSWWAEAGVNYWMPNEGEPDVSAVVKTGLNYEATEQLDLYTEVGAKLSQSFEDSYYAKVGFKYKF